MTTEEIISRCYEHGQPDYVLAADRLKLLQGALAEGTRGEVVAWRYINSLGEVVCEWIDGKPDFRCVDGRWLTKTV